VVDSCIRAMRGQTLFHKDNKKRLHTLKYQWTKLSEEDKWPLDILCVYGQWIGMVNSLIMAVIDIISLLSCRVKGLIWVCFIWNTLGLALRVRGRRMRYILPRLPASPPPRPPPSLQFSLLRPVTLVPHSISKYQRSKFTTSTILHPSLLHQSLQLPLNTSLTFNGVRCLSHRKLLPERGTRSVFGHLVPRGQKVPCWSHFYSNDAGKSKGTGSKGTGSINRKVNSQIMQNGHQDFQPDPLPTYYRSLAQWFHHFSLSFG
jgi:hypothetical protein